jgi:methylamine dehydrogenase accessory protein MauD
VGRLDGTGAVALAGGVALAVLAAATVYGWMALLRQNGRLLIRIDELEARLDGAGVAGASVAENHPGLPIGSPAPGFSLPGLYGEVVTLASLAAAERPVLLLFTDPGCGPCNALLPRVAELQRDQAGAVTVAVLTRGSAEEYRAKAREHGVSGVLLDGVLEVYNAYQAIGTPGAVLVDAAGRIASPVVGGSEAIEGLIAQVLGGLPAEPAPLHVVQAGAAAPAPGAPAPAPAQVRPALGPGDPAPALELAGLDGEPVPLVVLDRDTLVLFWNPHCGFCARMLDELRAWEAAPPSGAPRLLLIAAGSAEDNRAMGLAAEIAIDDRFAAGQAFGATGTPTGVLVDATGRIASGLAVGAPSVLALAGVATG